MLARKTKDQVLGQTSIRTTHKAGWNLEDICQTRVRCTFYQLEEGAFPDYRPEGRVLRSCECFRKEGGLYGEALAASHVVGVVGRIRWPHDGHLPGFLFFLITSIFIWL